jgi:DNA polymerase-3 subunit delta
MKELREDIKKGSYQRLYLFCGEEHYLIKHYELEMRKNIVPAGTEAMNLSIYQGKDVTADMIADAAETLPFFNEYRLILAKNTGFFAQGRKDESEKMSDYIAEIPETSVIIFIESDVDKRNGLYKKTAKAGRAVEFKTPQEKDLKDWIVKYGGSRHKKISSAAAICLLRTVFNDMDTLSSELDKLIAYKGDESEITSADIETVCNKSLESRIFDLVGAIGNKNTSVALDMFGDMLQLKESPIMVLTMIARQFRLILLCKHLADKKMSQDQIANKLGIRGFIVRECLKQGGNFSIHALKKALEECLSMDVKIKTGQMNDKLAVEMLILSVC